MQANFWPHRPIRLFYANPWLADEYVEKIRAIVAAAGGNTRTTPVMIDPASRRRLIELATIGSDSIGDGQLLLEVVNKLSDGSEDDDGPMLYLAVIPYANAAGSAPEDEPRSFNPAEAGTWLDDVVTQIEAVLAADALVE